MRLRDRQRDERIIRDLIGTEDPKMAVGVMIVWARDLPDDTWGLADSDITEDFYLLIINEAKATIFSHEENLDTYAHEAAHLLTWKIHGEYAEPAHGPLWRRMYGRMTAALDEVA